MQNDQPINNQNKVILMVKNFHLIQLHVYSFKNINFMFDIFLIIL